MAEENQSKRCPFCAEDVHQEAKICKHCKSDLNENNINNIGKNTAGSKTYPSRLVAAVLGIFLGGIGAHHAYIGKTNTFIVWLLACIFLSWTFIVPLILALAGLLQGIGCLLHSDESWKQKIDEIRLSR